MATTWTQLNKESGVGWSYNQSDLTYNTDLNAEGQSIKYNAAGTATSWSLQNES